MGNLHSSLQEESLTALFASLRDRARECARFRAVLRKFTHRGLSMAGAGSVSNDDSLADLRNVQLRPFFKVVGHQCFAYTNAAVLSMFAFEAAKQTLVTVTSVAVAITRQLGQRLRNFFSGLIRQLYISGEKLR